MKNLYIALGIAGIFALVFAVLVLAALGDYATSVTFSQNCSSGLGVGIAYDGQNLWYSCYDYGFESIKLDLYRANATTGQVTASYDIVTDGGLGALSYDATRNIIWAGEGGGGVAGAVYKIILNNSKDVTGTTLEFNVTAVVGYCGLDDGLAFDANNVSDTNDDVLYYSNDCGTTMIRVFNLSGNLVENFTWAGTSCNISGFATGYNSGLAIGGNLLYQGSDGCSHVWVVDKVSKILQVNFSTILAGDPNFRDEDLECDTNTFAAQGKHVMWSKEAYSPMRAHAFEIQFGSCGVGGVPPGICNVIETDTMSLQTNRWMYNGTAWITKLPKGTGPQRNYTIADTQGCGCKQILDWLHDNYPDEFGEMLGHYKYGCSISIMDEFIERTE